MPEHSPTPWKNAGITWEGDGSAGIALFDANDQMVAFVTDWPEFGQQPSEETEVNAAMILRAVNAHDALVAALREIFQSAEQCDKSYPNEMSCLEFMRFAAEAPESTPIAFREDIIGGKDLCVACRALAALAMVDGGKEEPGNA